MSQLTVRLGDTTHVLKSSGESLTFVRGTLIGSTELGLAVAVGARAGSELPAAPCSGESEGSRPSNVSSLSSAPCDSLKSAARTASLYALLKSAKAAASCAAGLAGYMGATINVPLSGGALTIPSWVLISYSSLNCTIDMWDAVVALEAAKAKRAELSACRLANNEPGCAEPRYDLLGDAAIVADCDEEAPSNSYTATTTEGGGSTGWGTCLVIIYWETRDGGITWYEIGREVLACT